MRVKGKLKEGSDLYKNEQAALRKFKLLKENRTFNLPLIYAGSTYETGPTI